MVGGGGGVDHGASNNVFSHCGGGCAVHHGRVVVGVEDLQCHPHGLAITFGLLVACAKTHHDVRVVCRAGGGDVALGLPTGWQAVVSPCRCADTVVRIPDRQKAVEAWIDYVAAVRGNR